jgi:hypothetical protein
MDTIERVMSYLADMRERGDDDAKDLFQALADMSEMFEAPEGYHTTKPFTTVDCDHGPCIGHTFADGWVMYTYTEDLARVSFHAPDEPTPLKHYEVCVIAEVSSTIKVAALDEDTAEAQAIKLFVPTEAEADGQRVLDIKEINNGA